MEAGEIQRTFPSTIDEPVTGAGATLDALVADMVSRPT